MLDVCGSRCGAKINGSYYCDELLSKQLLPAIRSTALFTFQQNTAPAHCARDTVAFLAHETPHLIGPELWFRSGLLRGQSLTCNAGQSVSNASMRCGRLEAMPD